VAGFQIEPDSYYSPQEYGAFEKKKGSTLAKERSLGTGPSFIRVGRTILYQGKDILQHWTERRARHSAERREKELHRKERISAGRSEPPPVRRG
jgi:hypothetical protein